MTSFAALVQVLSSVAWHHARAGGRRQVTPCSRQEGNGLETIFGCVTTGEDWQFLKLEHDVIVTDSMRYYINRIETILGMFQAILACYTPSLTTA